MAKPPRAFNYELPHDLNFDNFQGTAQNILETVKSVAVVEAATPTINTFDALAASEFLQKLGATIFSSIQLKHEKLNESALNSSEFNMDFGFSTNHVVLDSSAVDLLQQQVEYDKLMNDVWIGIVFTLILISMVFCVCSCFLYHQFRAWKRNYNNNFHSPSQCTIVDIETLKLHSELEDPVPEYTLVSGLPSYEAALELLQKAPPSSCLILYPSVFNVFNNHERANSQSSQTIATNTEIDAYEGALTLPQTQPLCDARTPLLTTTVTMTIPTMATSTPINKSIKTNFVSNCAEIFGFKNIEEQNKSPKYPILSKTKDVTSKSQTR